MSNHKETSKTAATKPEAKAAQNGGAKPNLNGHPQSSATVKPVAQTRSADQAQAAKKVQAAAKAKQTPGAVPTLAHTLGEMVWLMSQSPLHKHLKIADLEWLLMPAILLNQFRLFHAGEQVVGLALWAYLTPAQAEEMGKAGKLAPEHWRHGTDVLQLVKDQQAGKQVAPPEPELRDGEVELWLVDFILPFATPENKLAQVCMADLVRGPLKDKKLKMHKTEPFPEQSEGDVRSGARIVNTGEKSVIELGSN